MYLILVFVDAASSGCWDLSGRDRSSEKSSFCPPSTLGDFLLGLAHIQLIDSAIDHSRLDSFGVNYDGDV